MTTKLAVGAAILSAATVAMAQQTPTKVAVINIQAAIINTQEGQAAVKQLDTKFGPVRDRLEKQQAEIRAKQAELAKGRNTMSQQKITELNRDIDQLTRQFNRETEDASADSEQAQGKLLNELGQKVMEVVVKYCTDNGYTMVLDVSSQQGGVLWASSSVDITRQIIDLYDQKTAASGGTPAADPAKPPAATPPKPAAAPAAAPKPPAAKPN